MGFVVELVAHITVNQCTTISVDDRGPGTSQLTAYDIKVEALFMAPGPSPLVPVSAFIILPIA